VSWVNEHARRLRQRGTFGTDVDTYQQARPDYPERIYDLLTQVCGLGPGARVLEIGPDTGQATHRLLNAGAQVVAVEPGTRLGCAPS